MAKQDDVKLPPPKIGNMTESEIVELLAEREQLRDALKLSQDEAQRLHDESARASAAGQSMAFQIQNIQEVFSRQEEREEVHPRTGEPTGKKKTVDIWWYKIDLPPSGGLNVKLNGQPFEHGQVYEFTTDTLRTVKDIVFRCWAHERSIKGDNENFYRRELAPTLRGGGQARR